MKYLIVVGLSLAGLTTVLAMPQAGSNARAQELIQTLKLTVLPKESGYLGIIGRSAQMVTGRSEPELLHAYPRFAHQLSALACA